VRLAGVEVVVAESIERIHRTNLVGMGVLPLQFKEGETRKTYAIEGSETFEVRGDILPRATLSLVMTRKNGEQVEIGLTCRLDTSAEVEVYMAGGILQKFAKDVMRGGVS
jgi:aconitate hydratase